MKQLVKLFEPGRVGKQELKNRIVMGAMLVGYTEEPEGYVNDRITAFYVARAKGGVGLCIVTADFDPFHRKGFGTLNIYDDKYIPGLSHFVQEIHIAGGKCALQLIHPGLRLPDRDPKLVGLGPSAIAYPITGIVPKEMGKEDIEEHIKLYAEGARRAKEAGFDAVEIHGAHGYLPQQFLSPWTNKRIDEYGGTPQKRARFACDVIKRVKERVGSDFPIIFRMNADDFVEGGIKVEDALIQAPLLADSGADALHVSGGIRETYHWQMPPYMKPSACLAHLAAAVKKVVKVPIIAVGKIGDPFIAERILEERGADFICMARPLLADPELPNKAREGKIEEIRRCNFCNWCIDMRQYPRLSAVECAINPACGHELEYKLEPATIKKKVMVIGGGIAGMEAARTLAQREHDVTLCEKNERLGGQWNVVASYQPEVAAYTDYSIGTLKKSGVKVILGKEVDVDFVKEVKPDAVVLATGATPIALEIPGINSKHVVYANDVLLDKVVVGQEVVIVGGGLVGMEAAICLSRKGKKVSVIEMERIMQEAGVTFRLYFWQELIDLGISIYQNSKVYNITDKGVNVIMGGTALGSELFFIKADSVVLAVGSKAENGLQEVLKEFMHEVYSVGDCVKPRNTLEAIHEASKIGRQI